MNHRKQGLALALTLAYVAAAAAAEVQVMVLGTYHFGNPGQDVVNTQIDDVLSPRRQAELQTLTRRLAAFKPDKVMVERRATPPDSLELPGYLDWRQGKHQTRRNEVEQIGFMKIELYVTGGFGPAQEKQIGNDAPQGGDLRLDRGQHRAGLGRNVLSAQRDVQLGLHHADRRSQLVRSIGS